MGYPSNSNLTGRSVNPHKAASLLPLLTMNLLSFHFYLRDFCREVVLPMTGMEEQEATDMGKGKKPRETQGLTQVSLQSNGSTWN